MMDRFDSFMLGSQSLQYQGKLQTDTLGALLAQIASQSLQYQGKLQTFSKALSPSMS